MALCYGVLGIRAAEGIGFDGCGGILAKGDISIAGYRHAPAVDS